MDKKKLMNLIKREEGPKLDFKLKIDIDTESGRKELTKDIIAIGNSRGGRGFLIIGVEDKTKRIIGVENLSLYEEQIQQIISSRCEPPIPISLEFVQVENKNLAVIAIYDGGQKPYQMRENGAFYIRRGSTTDTMRKQELVSALQENLTLNVELCPIIHASLDCIDIKLVDEYFSSHSIEVNEENRLLLMENASIIINDRESGEYFVTLGGLLVFSKINYVYIPHNMIRIVNKVNKSMDEITIIQGDLISIIEKCEEVLRKILPDSYPIEAIYEGVKNAVLYRDYTIFYKEIEVIVTDKSISIISPGILVKGKDPNSHDYLRRNMWIYEKLVSLDKKKRFVKSTRGFSKMKKAFKNKGKVMFVNSLEHNQFKVIYPGAVN
jgi:predicted HTH transcriptional regulator